MLDNNKIEEISKGIFSFLEKNFKKEEIPFIVKRLLELTKNENNTAEVTTSIELTREEKEKVNQLLKEKFGKNLSSKYFIDKNILGGIRVKYNDMLIDYSFKNILRKIEEKISE